MSPSRPPRAQRVTCWGPPEHWRRCSQSRPSRRCEHRPSSSLPLLAAPPSSLHSTTPLVHRSAAPSVRSPTNHQPSRASRQRAGPHASHRGQARDPSRAHEFIRLWWHQCIPCACCVRRVARRRAFYAHHNTRHSMSGTHTSLQATCRLSPRMPQLSSHPRRVRLRWHRSQRRRVRRACRS